MPSKYKTLNGKVCDAELLEMADKFTQTGPLQLDGARQLWENALDGNKITERERNSIEHIAKNALNGLTDEANDFFKFWLKEKRVTKMTGSEIEEVDGVKCDRPMIEVAKIFKKRAAGKPLSLRAAEGVWFSALDGKGVTRREKDTLGVIARKYDFEASAKAFLENKLEWLAIAQSAAEVPAPDSDRVNVGPDAILLRFPDAVALSGAAPPSCSIHPSLSCQLQPDSSTSLVKPTPPIAALKPGSSVRLHDLQATELNDLQGICDKWDECTSRWMVRMQSGDVKALRAEKLQVVPVVGSKVDVHDLQACLELNDAQGTCEEYDKDKNRWMVRMHNGETIACGSENIRVIEVIGSKVQFRGLQSAPELNDVLGTCEEWDAGKARWMVRLENGEVRSVKSDNLKVLNVEAEPAPASRKRKRSDAPTITLKQLREIFDKCDINKDGLINKRELIISCRENLEIASFFKIPTTIRQEDGREKVEMLFQDIDKDSDRQIRWADLLAYYKHLVCDI